MSYNTILTYFEKKRMSVFQISASCKFKIFTQNHDILVILGVLERPSVPLVCY